MRQGPGITPCVVGEDRVIRRAPHLPAGHRADRDHRRLPPRHPRRQHPTQATTGDDQVTDLDLRDGHVAPVCPHWHLAGHAPGAVVLGASEPVGCFGGEQLDAGAVGEDELTQRPVPGVDPVLGEHGEDPALAFDAGVSGVRVGGGHYRPPRAGVGEGLLFDPFGAGAGLAPASAGEDEPHEPAVVVVGWALVGAGVPWDPVVR